ncbi:hypothetical protein SynA1524_00131 [Synechococcus sp. A15-24]|nr:hypothetical protein SynA1524_00131 [Synechococcus sp. A15-24]
MVANNPIVQQRVNGSFVLLYGMWGWATFEIVFFNKVGAMTTAVNC